MQNGSRLNAKLSEFDIIRPPILTSIVEMQTDDFSINHQERFDRLKKMDPLDFYEWMSRELSFWRSIRTTLLSNHRHSHFMETIIDYVSILESQAKSGHLLDVFESFHDSHPLPLHDEHPEPDLIQSLAHHGQFDPAIYTFQTHLKKSSHAYTKSYAEDLIKTEETFKNYITSEKNNFLIEIQKHIELLNKSLDIAEKEKLEKLKSDLEASKVEIANTLTAANKAILSAEPVQYWEERERKHKDKAKSYMKLLFLTAISFILLLSYLTISVYKDKNVYTLAGFQITLPAEKVSIALLIIVTTGAIWLTRVLVKLMMTNLALEIEALERSTMIKTYIAMDNAKGEQAQEIRMLFYSTLFKPSNNNLTDDSTSPEYIRIIEAMLQKKNTDKI